VGEPTTEITWTAGELLDQLRRRQKLFVLDVRNREEFERSPLEGAGLSAINLPYFEILESGGKDDMVDSVVACVERDLADRLPQDSPILAVCAKGDTSEYVMQGLQRLGYDAGSLKGGMKAWGNHYESLAILDTAGLGIFQISRPARGCLSYMVMADSEAIVIDPLRHLHPYTELARARSCTITSVIDTHSHADHISGGLALAAETGASYYLHPYDAIHPMDMLPATFAYEPMKEGQLFRAGQHELRVMHIPGHTLGLVALIFDDQYLFTGDSVFIRSIARPDLGGKAEAWARLHTHSLRRILELPEKITVLPAHFSSLEEGSDTGQFRATLAELKRSNESLVVLQRESDPGFVRYLLESLPRFIPEYVEIKRANTGLVSPSEDDAATLELGKNLCGLATALAAAHGESR
jgi:glyoxylase-like metal-dependent hydrolase (beta-lactamase superfamily II)/rhodanese-related sulfurtransferase